MEELKASIIGKRNHLSIQFPSEGLVQQLFDFLKQERPFFTYLTEQYFDRYFNDYEEVSKGINSDSQVISSLLHFMLSKFRELKNLKHIDDRDFNRGQLAYLFSYKFDNIKAFNQTGNLVPEFLESRHIQFHLASNSTTDVISKICLLPTAISRITPATFAIANAINAVNSAYTSTAPVRQKIEIAGLRFMLPDEEITLSLFLIDPQDPEHAKEKLLIHSYFPLFANSPFTGFFCFGISRTAYCILQKEILPHPIFQACGSRIRTLMSTISEFDDDCTVNHLMAEFSKMYSKRLWHHVQVDSLDATFSPF